MKQTNNSLHGLYTIGIAALFLTAFFMLVLFGARICRQTVDGRERNNDSRALLSYIAAAVHGSDAESAVNVFDADGVTVLEIGGGDSGYGRRIYQTDGILYEEYTALGGEIRPAGATEIGSTDIFTVSLGDDGLLTVTTDAGTVHVCLRSEGGWTVE